MGDGAVQPKLAWLFPVDSDMGSVARAEPFVGVGMTGPRTGSRGTGNGGVDTPLSEANSVFADPQVTSAAARDYHPTSASPMRNTGTDLSAAGLLTDYDGRARPQESAYDIGAYEYGP